MPRGENGESYIEKKTKQNHKLKCVCKKKTTLPQVLAEVVIYLQFPKEKKIIFFHFFVLNISKI